MAYQYESIEPLAFTLKPGLMQELYYLTFPAEWKQALLEIHRKYRPAFKDEYGLPTYALEKLINSWMEGIIGLSPLRANSQDDRWLTSCHPYDEKTLDMQDSTNAQKWVSLIRQYTSLKELNAELLNTLIEKSLSMRLLKMRTATGSRRLKFTTALSEKLTVEFSPLTMGHIYGVVWRL